MSVLARIRAGVRALRPVDPDFAAALARRWSGLPVTARTAGQVLGRHAVGCEGTHSVFPKCNLACTPCYHSRDANRVRVDGQHTLVEVQAQMALLRKVRGPRAHAQLIGGEVTLLDPDDPRRRLADHAVAWPGADEHVAWRRRLRLFRAAGARPRRAAPAAACVVRRAFRLADVRPPWHPRPPDEASLNPYRENFAQMFARLRREHKVGYFLAHTMTVTPANLGQVAAVVRECRHMGYGMFSFQPAAFVGDDRRWHEPYRDISGDQVWEQIERGVGAPLDYHVFEHGDVRCNRAAYGFWCGDRWFGWLDGDDPRDLAVRDAFFRYLGPVSFTGTPAPLLAARLALITTAHPRIIAIAGGWLARIIRRAGLRRLLAHPVRPVSYVMHQFMDAADVVPAWELMKRGETSDDPRIRATQERLAACHYAMAHPGNGTLVPACVQHSVLDSAENRALRALLPVPAVPSRGPESARTRTAGGEDPGPMRRR